MYVVRFEYSGDTIAFTSLKYAKQHIKETRRLFPNHTNMRIYKLVYDEEDDKMKVEDIAKELNNLTDKDLEFIDYFCIRNQIAEGKGWKIIFAKLISDYKKVNKKV